MVIDNYADANRFTNTLGFGWGYYPSLHIGATAWYIMAKRHLNPFWATTTDQPIPYDDIVPLQVVSLTDAPDPFSPNGDGIQDTTTISGTFDRPVDWRLVAIVIDNGPSRVFGFPAGPATAVSTVWDGRDQAGTAQPNGTHTCFVVGGITSTGEQAQRSGTITIYRPTSSSGGPRGGGGGGGKLQRSLSPGPTTQ